jgi:hypothetical protein
MTVTNDERVAVTLNVLPAFEERVIDWLIDRDDVSGFTTYSAFGHSARHHELTAAEQVSGRQRRVEIRVELRVPVLEGFLAALAARFGGTDLYYYVVPVLRSGHLRRIVE